MSTAQYIITGIKYPYTESKVCKTLQEAETHMQEMEKQGLKGVRMVPFVPRQAENGVAG